MTIKKTYQLQVDYPDGRIEHVERKGITAKDALKHADEEFTEAYYVSVTGRKRDPKWRRYYKNYEQTPVFPHNPNRFGEYVYRHKGRPVRGRTVQPKQPYGARLHLLPYSDAWPSGPVKFVNEWIKLVTTDLPIQVSIP